MALIRFIRSLEARLNRLMARLIVPCADIARLLSESMDRSLPLGTRLRIRFHLVLCVYCRRYGRQLRFISEAAHRMHEHIDEMSGEALSANAKKRLKEVLHNGPN